ncbi:MAG: 50S ribosomal protein L25 [Acidobacteria bacterium]|nr:50S ribosomal protein L25 [Acidobacteriota bacterium]
MEKVIIEAKRRWDLGKNGARRLRNEGMIPAILYGVDEEPVPLAIDRKLMDQYLHSEGGRNRVYMLKMDESNQKEVLIRDYQLDPVRDELIHVDFLKISHERPVEVSVPIVTEGVPIGVKNAGGVLVILRRDLPVRCLPQDVPVQLIADVSDLDLHQRMKIKDLKVAQNVKILADGEINIAVVESTRTTEAGLRLPAEGGALAGMTEEAGGAEASEASEKAED